LFFFIEQKHTKQYKNWWRGTKTKLQYYTIYIDEEEQNYKTTLYILMKR